MENVVKEIGLLTATTQLSQQALHVTKKADKPSVITALNVYEKQVGEVSTEYLRDVKQTVLLATAAAKRFLQSGKESDAKLVRRHCDAISKEFSRLSRIARRGGDKRGV